LLYKSNGSSVVKINCEELSNTYVEGEGAAVAQVVNKHLPPDDILFNHYRRVLGAYKYILSYFQVPSPKINWNQYGFRFDNETQLFSPILTSSQQNTISKVNVKTESKIKESSQNSQKHEKKYKVNEKHQSR